jgi:SAM-dependent methyltransferase
MNKISMRREVGKDYANYNEYIEHQKVKTTDPKRRELWLNKEWDMKIKIFEDIFEYYKKNYGLKDKDKAICFGARTGQEVVALKNLNLDAIGIDIVPQEPYVIIGDIHNAPFEENTFDFVFTNIMDHSIYPDKFVSEMERVLKPGGHCLVQLQLNCKSDEYAENDIHNSESVIKLFKSSKLILDRDIPFTLSMNREFLMKKS